MSRQKHCIYLTLGWLLIFFLLTPSTYAISAWDKKGESRKPVAIPKKRNNLVIFPFQD
jgi:hypothetical protein